MSVPSIYPNSGHYRRVWLEILSPDSWIGLSSLRVCYTEPGRKLEAEKHWERTGYGWEKSLNKEREFFFFSSPSQTSLRAGDFKKNLEWNKYGRVAMSKGNEWESLKNFKILLQCTYLFSGYLKSTNKFCYFKIALWLDIFILTLIPVILGTIWIYIIVFHMHDE